MFYYLVKELNLLEEVFVILIFFFLIKNYYLELIAYLYFNFILVIVIAYVWHDKFWWFICKNNKTIIFVLFVIRPLPFRYPLILTGMGRVG